MLPLSPQIAYKFECTFCSCKNILLLILWKLSWDKTDNKKGRHTHILSKLLWLTKTEHKHTHTTKWKFTLFLNLLLFIFGWDNWIWSHWILHKRDGFLLFFFSGFRLPPHSKRYLFCKLKPLFMFSQWKLAIFLDQFAISSSLSSHCAWSSHDVLGMPKMFAIFFGSF